MKNIKRRTFINRSGQVALGLSIPFTAKSYSRILGANDRMRVGIAGLNGRGQALIDSVSKAGNGEVTYLCDVDNRVFEKSLQSLSKYDNNTAKTTGDIREVLESSDVDAIAIATPDHWHTHMALMGLDAGKHVYVEKPCGHNPHEGEMLSKAAQNTDLVITMGNQQRSAPTSIMAIQDIRDGLIGEVYMGKCWYANNRGPIGKAQPAAVPEWLDWEMWQGPAPRMEYKDIYVHYNWHWFWHWGTGEACNNGTHEIDVCRWALGVDYPTKVSSSGGRYHYKDDWEFYDTQIANFEFGADKLISWEGRSCNSYKMYERDRGSAIYGTEGTIILDRNLYQAFDKDGKLIKEEKESGRNNTTGTVGGGNMEVQHMRNFFAGIREGEPLNSPIPEGHKSVLLCHLSNISQKMERSLEINPENGHIIGDEEAMKMWSRSYEPGWEPTI